MASYKAVFFDMGGTLVQSSPSFYEAIYRAYIDFEVKVPMQMFQAGLRAAWARLGKVYGEWVTGRGFADEAFWLTFNKAVLRKLGYLKGLNALAQKIWVRAESLLKDAKLYCSSEVFDVLSNLKAQGYMLGVISNWDESLKQGCNDFGLAEYLDVILASQAVGIAKPDPRLFEAAVDKAGVQAEEALYVGDVYYTDAIGASRAGLTPILLDPQDLFPDATCIRIRRLNEIIPLLLDGRLTLC